jgi:MinD superfamily P-loop ATPase
MKQLVVLSGKGGTGKTTLTGALLHLASKKALADCDVDAPNLHLICGERTQISAGDYYGLKKAHKDETICLNCGLCEELCKFGAIRDGKVSIYECEGCGVCAYFCPAVKTHGRPAITLQENSSGQLFLSQVHGEVFSHAVLKMGNGASGKLVTEVRKQLAEEVDSRRVEVELVIIDGSPGIGCPVLASVTGVDLVLLVTEPSASGLHDLKRIVETVRNFKIPMLVCINKYDLNKEQTREIEEYCQESGIKTVGRIPYDPLVSAAINNGRSIIEYPESPAARAIQGIWRRTAKALEVPVLS